MNQHTHYCRTSTVPGKFEFLPGFDSVLHILRPGGFSWGFARARSQHEEMFICLLTAPACKWRGNPGVGYCARQPGAQRRDGRNTESPPARPGFGRRRHAMPLVSGERSHFRQQPISRPISLARRIAGNRKARGARAWYRKPTAPHLICLWTTALCTTPGTLNQVATARSFRLLLALFDTSPPRNKGEDRSPPPLFLMQSTA